MILFEIEVKGFLWTCAKKTSIYGQNNKVVNSERYWTPLTKDKIPGVILIHISSAYKILKEIALLISHNFIKLLFHNYIVVLFLPCKIS